MRSLPESRKIRNSWREVSSRRPASSTLIGLAGIRCWLPRTIRRPPDGDRPAGGFPPSGAGTSVRMDSPGAPRCFRSRTFWRSRLLCASIFSKASVTAARGSPSVSSCAFQWRLRWLAMISAPNRCFSWDRTMRTLAGPPRCRSSFGVRRRAGSSSTGVTSTLRPVHSTLMPPPVGESDSERLLALRGGGDPQLLAVLRDGPSRDLDPLGAQALHDAGVRMRAPRILIGDVAGDLALDRQRRDVGSGRGVDSAVEEVFHREEAARRVDVFVGTDARDRGLVHPDVVGDVAQHERPEVLDTLVEELPLVAHDRVGDLVDRPLALVEALDEPDRRAHLVLEVRRGLLADRA